MSISALAVLGRGIVDPDTPLATAEDVGLTRGDGCFEGLRMRRLSDGAEIEALDGHLARMGRSTTRLGIPFDEAAWRELAATLAEAWFALATASGEEEAAVKFVLTRGRPGADDPTGFGYTFPLAPDTDDRRQNGIDVVVLDRGYSATSFAGAPWLLGGVKTLSYAVNMAAQREAARRGAHEPLFVTCDGELLEAPTSSVVWVNGTTIRTVDDTEANGILHSVTLETLWERAPKDGWDVIKTSGTVADLLAADVVVLISSVVGPLRVRSVDGRPLPAERVGLTAYDAIRRLTDF